jgi:hypothetical protein
MAGPSDGFPDLLKNCGKYPVGGMQREEVEQ